MNLALFFTPEEVLVRGFRTIKGLPVITCNDYNKKNVSKFKEHFGPTPSVVGCIWTDILTNLDLPVADQSERGFVKLLRAMHFLWAYPRNAALLASTTGTCKRNVEGKNLWQWVKLLQDLKSDKIVWPTERYNNPNGQQFLCSVDGTDCKIREISNEIFNIDKSYYSQKLNHCALKYEIAIDCFSPKIVWLNGPFRGGKHDKDIFDGNLRQRIPLGKKVIADRGYASTQNIHCVALPNLCDAKELGNFKARCRARHESLNGRLKNFTSLSVTFRHRPDKHQLVFDAVCVIVQYELDCGHPIFAA